MNIGILSFLESLCNLLEIGLLTALITILSIRSLVCKLRKVPNVQVYTELFCKYALLSLLCSRVISIVLVPMFPRITQLLETISSLLLCSFVGYFQIYSYRKLLDTTQKDVNVKDLLQHQRVLQAGSKITFATTALNAFLCTLFTATTTKFSDTHYCSINWLSVAVVAIGAIHLNVLIRICCYKGRTMIRDISTYMALNLVMLIYSILTIHSTNLQAFSLYPRLELAILVAPKLILKLLQLFVVIKILIFTATRIPSGESHDRNN